MGNNDLHRALTRATDALRGTLLGKYQRLSLPETAFILTTLPDTPELSKVRAQLAQNLRTQLSIPWIKKGDSFDVFTVLTALWNYQQTTITGEHLACAVRRLIKSEMATGGPYYSNGKVDIAVNAQIALFMRAVAAPLPKLNAFLADATATQHFKNTQLARPYLLYLLGKACPTATLTKYMAEQRHQKSWQTPWRKAVALAILKDTAPTAEIRRSLMTLCARQHYNGFWSGEPLLKTGGGTANSQLTATTLILAALADYQRAHIVAPRSSLGRQHRMIEQAAKQAFTTCRGPLRTSALATIKQMCDADKNFEITLLPQFFAQALNTSKALTPQQRTTLGLASLCAWMAYTIYDDFLDGEGVAAKLPVANIAMRASLDCFRAALPHRVDFLQYVAKTFTAMDEANAWEVNHCRFTIIAEKITIPKLPAYGGGSLLAARSFAHALAPMAVLAQLLPHSPKAYNRIESAFRHYLIARQLNDDIHDWIKDMQAGQASYAVTAILRDLRVRPGAYRLSTLLPAMQKRFRLTTMPKICQRILWHIDKSRKAFAQSKLLRSPNNIYSLLDNLEQSVQHSLDQHSKTQAFYANTRKLGWE